LTSITIPSSVTSIGNAPFIGCTKLASITVDVNNPSYADIGGVLFNHNKTKLIQYPCGYSNTYTIPDDVTSIAEESFSSCSGLTSVTIPSSVTSIGNYAFSGVNMGYANYLGTTEPTCVEQTQSTSTTFVDVDVVCVPLDYNSTTFCKKYHVKVSSCEEFVSQHNQCYEVLDWQAEEITVKKRANATLWEKKTNNCFEYECVNTSGGFAWSKCNTTDDTQRMCIENECVEGDEAFDKDTWGVEVRVNITPNDLDLDELTNILNNATGINEIRIGTEAVSSTGNVVRIVIYVNDENIANTIANFVEDKNKGGECTYGILCNASTAQVIRQEEFVALSGTHKVQPFHNDEIILLIITCMLTMIFVIMK